MSVRVVIAEDEAIIRLDLKETLEQEGYEVVGLTGRGDEAVTLVRNLKPDLAILDIKMPVMDGIAAAKEITTGRMAAVLILTAFSQRELVQQATEAGAMSYLVKPFQTSALIPAIEVALARFAEVTSLEQQSDDLREQLETRRLVHRAQGVLQDQCGMNEAEAFTFIQRTAMRQRTRMKVVAEQILAGTLRPGTNS
jgi:AmiR/NasT family two-component response regulator